MSDLNLSIFESIKKTTDSQNEYWSARELAKTLEYAAYRNFETVIEKAKESCKNSRQPIQNHFVDVDNMVQVGSGAKRTIPDFLLTRYACYLVMQNADPSKEIVALGQTYFAIHQLKKLKKSQQILDHMDSEELAANLFRATQTDAKIRRENIRGEAKANQTHFEVGRKVRQTIKEIGGTMPEKLPISDSITKSKSRLKKLT